MYPTRRHDECGGDVITIGPKETSTHHEEMENVRLVVEDEGNYIYSCGGEKREYGQGQDGYARLRPPVRPAHQIPIVKTTRPACFELDVRLTG